VTSPRARFVKATPADGELSRWTVQVGLHSPGVVVSKRWGQASAMWLVYPDADPNRVLRYTDGRRVGKVRVFLSRREAGDALILHEAPQHPDLGPAAADD
jgi:hypothetical protein